MRHFFPAVGTTVRIRLLAAALLAVASPAVRGQAAEAPARNVLLLQSYQQGPAWVQNINDGVLSVFAQSRDFRFNYRFEYMNILDADPSGYPEVYRRRLARRRFGLKARARRPAACCWCTPTSRARRGCRT